MSQPLTIDINAQTMTRRHLLKELKSGPLVLYLLCFRDAIRLMLGRTDLPPDVD